jgi:hypothetical protein
MGSTCRFSVYGAGFALLFLLLPLTVSSAWGGEPDKGAAAANGNTALSSADRNALALLGPKVLGKPLPPKPITDAAHFFPLKQETRVYRVTHSHGVASQAVFRYTRLKHSRTGASWLIHAGKEYRDFIARTADGNVEIPVQMDLKEHVITRFRPSEPVLFSGLKAGETRTKRVKASVFPLHGPHKAKYHGGLTVETTYLGMFEVTVPAGRFPAALIRTSYRGKIGPAEVKDAEYRFYAPGKGVVAVVEMKNISAFLVYNKHEKKARVLVRISANG